MANQEQERVKAKVVMPESLSNSGLSRLGILQTFAQYIQTEVMTQEALEEYEAAIKEQDRSIEDVLVIRVDGESDYKVQYGGQTVEFESYHEVEDHLTQMFIVSAELAVVPKIDLQGLAFSDD